MIKRKQILKYVEQEIRKGRFPTRVKIEKMLRTDLRTHFRGIKDLYKSLGISYTPIKERIIRNRIRLATQKRRRFWSKEEGRKVICEFIKNKAKSGDFPTYREINKRFRISLFSYFSNLKEAYDIADVEYPRRFLLGKKRPTSKQKQKVKQKILDFIQKELNKGSYPTKKQIQKKFRIELKTYFSGGIKQIYEELSKDYLKIRRLQKRKVLSRFKTLEDGRKEITKFIIDNVKRGIFPGYNEINSALGINLNSYFPSIKEAYKRAGVFYKKEPNQLIALEKQEKLREIALVILRHLEFRVLIPKNFYKEDICVIDKNNNIIPVELKAYHKTLSIPNRLPFLNRKVKNEFEQLHHYMKKYNSPYGILMTTTDKITVDIPSDIKVISAKRIKNILIQIGSKKLLKNLKWVRNAYTSEIKEVKKNITKEKIAIFVRESLDNGHLPKRREIEKKFNIDIRTYFPGTISDVYQYSKVPIPFHLSKKLAK